ncbi:hypothetical protein HPP92_012772 [Vanilla planifolia]|uniref:Knottins-like domain-containing protein n=1 Tax=Vanilla planifolia TaxID=51239 RepID=A0A835R145_VANPL|nr:hypothetical protein HPP92_012772 [Vanilla planifolia]
MEKKGSSSAFFLLLLLFFSGNMSFSEARRCRAQSFTFKGICYSSHSCALVCKKEGYETGHCSRREQHKIFCICAFKSLNQTKDTLQELD